MSLKSPRFDQTPEQHAIAVVAARGERTNVIHIRILFSLICHPSVNVRFPELLSSCVQHTGWFHVIERAESLQSSLDDD